MSLHSHTSQRRLNIHPGEWYFGKEYDVLYTLLGSCVALTVWHPKLKLGGVCHYLLPSAPEQSLQKEVQSGNQGRYAATVLSVMKQQMLSYASINEYQISLFGGSNTNNNFTIGKQNVLYAKNWLVAQKITPTIVDLGGNKSRTLVLNVLSGEVAVKTYPITPNDKQL